MSAPHAADPELALLAARVHDLSGHPLVGILRDQLRIIRRIDEDPDGLFPPADPLGAWSDALTTWERAHLRARLADYLDVLETNQRHPADQPRLNVRDFGATGDGVTDDRPALQRAFAALLALGRPATLVFPAGRYALLSLQEPTSHLVVRGLADATLVGEPGAELLGQGSAAVLRLESCRNVRVHGLTFDYDPPLASEGRVVSLDRATQTVLWRADPGCPTPDVLSHGQAHLGACMFATDTSADTAETALMRRGQHHLRATSWERADTSATADSSLWRLTLKGADLAPLTAGDRLVIYRRFKWTQAVVFSECAWIDLADLAIHGAPEFALFLESCTGVSVRRCRVVPPAGRVGGLNADGIHARSNRFGPFFSDCEIRNVQDDCFNLQSRMVSVVEVLDAHTLVLDLPWHAADRIGYWHPRRGDYAPGDMLAFLSPMTGEFAGWAAITATAEHDWRGHRRLRATLDRPVAGLVSRESLGKNKPVMSSSEYLGAPAGVPIEHFVVNASTKADGFIIRDCVFGNNSVTGGKIKAGNGLILGNRSRNHGWCVWSFATEMGWQEGYALRRVLVQGNHHDNWFGIFMGSQYPFDRTHFGVPLHYRVEILDNTIIHHAKGEYALDLNCVVGCTISGNVLSPDRPIALGPTARHVRVEGNTTQPGN